MLKLTPNVPPEVHSEAEAMLHAARVKLNDAERVEADQNTREHNLIERHSFLVAKDRRLREYEEKLTAWDADLRAREAILKGTA